jgi:hypothetical protein
MSTTGFIPPSSLAIRRRRHAVFAAAGAVAARARFCRQREVTVSFE